MYIVIWKWRLLCTGSEILRYYTTHLLSGVHNTVTYICISDVPCLDVTCQMNNYFHLHLHDIVEGFWAWRMHEVMEICCVHPFKTRMTDVKYLHL